ncbi:MAG TPA: type II toxin-antitoxin system PemK/MazF family toxin [Acidobacteriota bacterium]|nr:type II toxin-antitoxin system PemK/MazF family toxin [Acidobacteriota bacterium]
MRQVFDVPDRGDIVLLAFEPGSRRRRSGPRPVVVVSPQAYNARTGLALVCPIVADIRSYPFEVLLPPGLAVEGAVLADQAASLDWRACRAERIGALPAAAGEELFGKLRALIG